MRWLADNISAAASNGLLQSRAKLGVQQSVRPAGAQPRLQTTGGVVAAGAGAAGRGGRGWDADTSVLPYVRCQRPHFPASPAFILLPEVVSPF